jgi:hypothetical protein
MPLSEHLVHWQYAPKRTYNTILAKNGNRSLGLTILWVPPKDSLATTEPSGYDPAMGRSDSEPKMPEQTKRLIDAILKVKPTADMPRPGAQPQKPRKGTKRKAK